MCEKFAKTTTVNTYSVYPIADGLVISWVQSGFYLLQFAKKSLSIHLQPSITPINALYALLLKHYYSILFSESIYHAHRIDNQKMPELNGVT